MSGVPVTNIEELGYGERVEVWWHLLGEEDTGEGENYVPFYGKIMGQNGNTIQIKFDGDKVETTVENPFTKKVDGSDDLLISKIYIIDDGFPRKTKALILAAQMARAFPEFFQGGGRRRKKKTRKRKAGMPPKNTTRDRLRKKLLEKQQKQLQKIGVANYQRDTSFMRHMVSPEIKKRLTDMKNAGIDPQTAYDQLKEEYALNQFINEVSISKAKREAETTDDKMAKIQGDLLQLKEEQEEIYRQTKKDRAKRKKANKKKKKKAISNLLNQPIGSGKPIKWDEDIMHMDTGGEGSDRMYSREGGRRKKTRKMKGGHHLYKRLGVSKYASQKQIKKAYNKLKKKKKLTKKVKHAYKILSKKKTRKQYNMKYKKMKKVKRTKRRRNKGGMPSVVIKGQIFPSGFVPNFNIPETGGLNAPAWLSNL